MIGFRNIFRTAVFPTSVFRTALYEIRNAWSLLMLAHVGFQPRKYRKLDKMTVAALHGFSTEVFHIR